MIAKRIALLGGLLATASALLPLSAAAQEKLRITLDTNPSHVRNKGVEIFAEELKKRVGNKVAIEIYPGQFWSKLPPVFSTWLPGLLLSK